MTAREIIKQEYGNSRNFMTPEVLEIGMATHDIAYEISKGKGISDNIIYGLSVVKLHPDGITERMYDISGCHSSLKEAREVITNLN